MSESYKSVQIVHITDTFDHRARAKIDGAYSLHQGELGIRSNMYSFIPALNSIDAGISASEVITNTQRPKQLIIAINYAPPDADKPQGTVDNARKDFFCAQLKNDVVLCGTTNGYEFSYVKSEIENLYRLTNTNSLKSQFRSLEILPEHTLLFSEPEQRARLITSGILERVENIDDFVPTVPEITHVHEVDNFQNVKLFPSVADLMLLRQHENKKIGFGFGVASVEIGTREAYGETKYDGVVADTLFRAPHGTNVVALRSSSRLIGFEELEFRVPIIATIRQRPAETQPSYEAPIVGAPVWFKPQHPQCNAA
jgi:hypothetical protein